MKAGPQVPPLHIFSGTESTRLPDEIDEYLPNALIDIQENGSMTLDIFIKYMEKVLIPYVQRSVPGGLKKGVREALITIDLPKVHNIPSWLRMILRDEGIHLYAFPHNSTSWSQACDQSYIFGAFKRRLYDLIDKLLRHRAERGDNSGKIRTEDIPVLIKLSWEAVTPKRITAAMLTTGIVLGHSTVAQTMRKDVHDSIILQAPDTSTSLLFQKSKKKNKLTPFLDPKIYARDALMFNNLKNDGSCIVNPGGRKPLTEIPQGKLLTAEEFILESKNKRRSAKKRSKSKMKRSKLTSQKEKELAHQARCDSRRSHVCSTQHQGRKHQHGKSKPSKDCGGRSRKMHSGGT